MKDDERTHTLLCASFAAFKKTRPTKTAVLALYFPITTYGEKGLSAPKIVWVDPQHEMHIVERKTDGTVEYIDPLRHDPFELRFTQPRNLSTPVEARGFDINQNYSKEFHLLYPVVLHMRKAFNFDGSRPNLTLIEVSREQLQNKWKGPLILYSKKTFSSSSGCRDVTLSDFRTLLDFCKVYGRSEGGLGSCLLANNFIEVEMTNPSLFATMLLHSSGDRTFQGVEIACEGDKEFLKTGQFMSVAVPVIHPIFDDINYDNGLIAGFGATEVSKMIDLPLLVRRIFPDKRWNRKSEMKPTTYINPVAEYLNLNTDVQSVDWGFPDLGFPKGNIYGRVLVVRKDQLAITARQVETVCAFFNKVSSTSRASISSSVELHRLLQCPITSESKYFQFPRLSRIINS